MRRFVARALPSILLSTLVLTAAPGHAASPRLEPHKSVSVALYISGSLGDLGFFDSANAGVQRAAKELGAQVKVIQQSDSTQWQAQIEALARSKKELVGLPKSSSGAPPS